MSRPGKRVSLLAPLAKEAIRVPDGLPPAVSLDQVRALGPQRERR